MLKRTDRQCNPSREWDPGFLGKPQGKSGCSAQKITKELAWENEGREGGCGII